MSAAEPKANTPASTRPGTAENSGPPDDAVRIRGVDVSAIMKEIEDASKPVTNISAPPKIKTTVGTYSNPTSLKGKSAYQQMLERVKAEKEDAKWTPYDDFNKAWFDRAGDGNLDAVREASVHQNFKVDWINRQSFDRTGLMAACLHGHAEVVDFLLNQGSNPRNRDAKGKTPLILGAQGGHALVCKVLIDFGVPTHYRDNLNMSALSYALSCGHHGVVQVFVDAGVNPRDEGGVDLGEPYPGFSNCLSSESLVQLTWARAESKRKGDVRMLAEKLRLEEIETRRLRQEAHEERLRIDREAKEKSEKAVMAEQLRKDLRRGR